MEIDPDDLSAEAVAAALVGTWRCAAHGEPSGVDYVHFSEDGRVFHFVRIPQRRPHDPERAEQRFPVRYWYSVESPSSFRLRMQGDPNGSLYDLRLEGAALTLGKVGWTGLFSRAVSEEIPEWFREGLAKRILHP